MTTCSDSGVRWHLQLQPDDDKQTWFLEGMLIKVSSYKGAMVEGLFGLLKNLNLLRKRSVQSLIYLTFLLLETCDFFQT